MAATSAPSERSQASIKRRLKVSREADAAHLVELMAQSRSRRAGRCCGSLTEAP